MPDFFLGRMLGEYQVNERIGHGASAVVYRAYQASVNRDVALKIIRLDLPQSDDVAFQQQFAREAKLIASLEHLHILPVYDYNIVNNVAYIAMRLLRGGSLEDVLKRGALPPEEAVEILIQVASGLAHAHNSGVVHRDIKPSNILFDESKNVYLSDFGLAHLIGADHDPASLLAGTPGYIAPEALRGEVLDHRADIYGFGVLAYQMLTGHTPFDTSSGDVLTLLRRQMEKPVPRLRDYNPNITPELEMVVLHAMHKYPQARFQSVDAMASALNAALGRRQPLFNEWNVPVISLGVSSEQKRTKRTPRRLRMSGPVMFMTLIFMLMIFLSVMRNISFSSPEVGKVLVGETGTLEDIRPRFNELDLARQQLGERGFIAFIACDFKSETQLEVSDQLTAFAVQNQLLLQNYDSEGDSYKQITKVERARLEGARAFIICPLDPAVTRSHLAALQEAKMPVVFMSWFESGYGVIIDVQDTDVEKGYLISGRLCLDAIVRLLAGVTLPEVIVLPPDAQVNASS